MTNHKKKLNGIKNSRRFRKTLPKQSDLAVNPRSKSLTSRKWSVASKYNLHLSCACERKLTCLLCIADILSIWVTSSNIHLWEKQLLKTCENILFPNFQFCLTRVLLFEHLFSLKPTDVIHVRTSDKVNTNHFIVCCCIFNQK